MPASSSPDSTGESVISMAPALRLLLLRLRNCSCTKRRRLRAFSASISLVESLCRSSECCDVDVTADADVDVDGGSALLATASMERRDVGVAEECVDRDALLTLLEPVEGCRARLDAMDGRADCGCKCVCAC